MTREHAIRIVELWAEGHAISLREDELDECHNLCLAALREQEQRKQGCEYCKDGFAVLNETMEYSGLEFALMKNTLRARYFPSHEYTTFKTQDILSINFCPMCGRKLGGNSND